MSLQKLYSNLYSYRNYVAEYVTSIGTFPKIYALQSS